MSVSVQIVCDNCKAYIIQNQVGVVTPEGSSFVRNINDIAQDYRDSKHYCSPACMVKVYSNQVDKEWVNQKESQDQIGYKG